MSEITQDKALPGSLSWLLKRKEALEAEIKIIDKQIEALESSVKNFNVGEYGSKEKA